MSISETHLKGARLNDLADLAKTLGNSHRLLLLEHIGGGEKTVEALSDLAGLSVANASQHLQQLKRSGFVQSRREGKNVLYRLGGGPIAALLAALRACAEHNRSEIRELISDSLWQQDKLEAISREELLQRMQETEIVLLDVRSESEYAAGHLPGAVNIPLDELELRLAEVPRDQEVVAYCRGNYCALSGKAVTILRALGRNARQLRGGM
ncbi:ArsR/SmtB family transcription factor [Chromobacterium alticapitis]|uniref:ArsR family transcriptional regulator n=1 Tax=Chromobacterium alticapitis TaxID=2073169 RepID=A0A2S5DEJ8_9NEIS|nr:metalloregulator ArsR/SmtB family transcription factor [Chromobacterium alticapitis]POZ61402.1 ArsR family transcriptional regulator [Chromobacterium alticapitis]